MISRTFKSTAQPFDIINSVSEFKHQAISLIVPQIVRIGKAEAYLRMNNFKIIEKDDGSFQFKFEDRVVGEGFCGWTNQMEFKLYFERK